jgi:hypothetical protein
MVTHSVLIYIYIHAVTLEDRTLVCHPNDNRNIEKIKGKDEQEIMLYINYK